ncbi:MAG: carboxylesterase family protein [Lachnospiraceae bacterium]|nr:carboxylesterase family protein [Lachnospiraceae bacterium]
MKTEQDVIVTTKQGKLRGTKEAAWSSFLGIPYAKPPVGALRWREPEAPAPWTGVRDACTLGSPALQAPSQSIPGGDPAERGVFDGGNEDCLYLNVWTPECREDAKLPVFVWIHGGAFCCGSGGGKNASPAPFCRRGIIFVTFNYRLGLMGYFVHPELSAESPHGVSGNYAHFDQIAALRWVHENIAAFGGDPEKVTIGGCSAGAGSTQILSCSPLAEGLFARAIIESSVSIDGGKYPEEDKLQTMKEMEPRGVEHMERVGCHSIEEMRALSYEELIDFEECHFRRKYHWGTTLGVCEDGYLLPRHYPRVMGVAENRNIPYLVGCTHDEGGGHVLGLTPERFHEKSEAVFREACAEYEKLCQVESTEEAVRCMRETHLQLVCGKVFAARSAAAGKAPVYVFDFRRKSPVNELALHGYETHFLLGTYRNLPGVTEEDDAVAETMQEYWCQFIKTGDPNGEGRPVWSPYAAEHRSVLYLDAPSEVAEDRERENPRMTFAREFLEQKGQ